METVARLLVQRLPFRSLPSNRGRPSRFVPARMLLASVRELQVPVLRARRPQSFFAQIRASQDSKSQGQKRASCRPSPLPARFHVACVSLLRRGPKAIESQTGILKSQYQ